jgi:hypothetical protein
MKRVKEPVLFTPVTVTLETEKELAIMSLIAHNVQPREIAEWSEKVTQAEASEFLKTLHRILS